MRGKLWLGFLVVIVLLWVICIYAVLSSMSVREVFIELGHHVLPSAITMIEMRTELNELREETLAYILGGDVVSEGKTSREQLEELYGELRGFAEEHLEHEIVVRSKTREEAEKLATLSQKIILASAEITKLKDQGAGVDELLEKMDQDFRPAFVPLRGLIGELITEHQKELSAVENLVHEKHDVTIRFILIVGIIVALAALVVALSVDRFFVRYITQRKKLEEGLKESEEKWRSLTENTDDTVLIADKDDVIQYINKTIPPETLEEVIGKTVYKYVSKEYHQVVRESLKKVYQTGKPDRYEVALNMQAIDPKIGTLWYSTNIVPIKQDQKTVSVIMVSTNITERKKMEEALRKQTDALNERVKELNCLYGISELVESEGISLEEILEGTVNLIPPSWQYPEVTCARIILEDQTFRTKNFKETAWKQTSDIMVRGKKIGSVEVFYLEEKPNIDEGPFLKEERSLIDAIAHQLGRVIDRRDAERELRIKEEAIASSVNAIALADLEGNLTYVNRSFLDMWGYVNDREVLGKPVTEFWEKREKVLEILKALACEKNWMGELVARRKNGSTFDVQLLANIVENEAGKAICIMASVVDITERKKIEQMKSDFVSLASHELRTPLTSIVGYVDLLLDGDTGEINKEQREFLEIISRNTQRFEALINDVLDVEKIESGRIQLKQEKVNLSEIVEISANTFKIMAETKGLKLEKEIKTPELEILGDPDRLSQVFSNLLSNAIKYTKEGEVKVLAQNKGRFASVIVEDTGLGMTRDELRSVFTRFFRSEDSYVRKTSGTGLGLSIAKATIERHNGEIKVESKLGVGSKFEVILPLLKEDEEAQQ